ncbi:hypothetical protein LCGC14_1211470 [marine sediment metagenome]|uniref:Uncharacterized protein n=1 Tax=marine sediment metagenome TaxID=412755 RepID=A0A0F9PII5_9ZZZZ
MTPRTFKILDVIGITVLVVAAYVFFAGPHQVEVQDSIPHKVIQDQVE